MSKDIFFDNIIITEELAIAEKWAVDTFDKKRQKISKDSVSGILYSMLILCAIILLLLSASGLILVTLVRIFW